MTPQEIWDSFTEVQKQTVTTIAVYADRKGLIKGIFLGVGASVAGVIVQPIVEQITNKVKDRKQKKAIETK